MIFQKYIEATDIEKIEEYLAFLGFITPSSKESQHKVYQKHNITIVIKVNK